MFRFRNSTGAAFGKMVSPIVAGTVPAVFLERQSANVPTPFDFRLAGNSFKSVCCDKASRAETRLWRSRLQTRSLRSCRRADLELASGRLKLACIPTWIIKVLARLLRTANDARWRNKQQEACARVAQNFLLSPNSNLACLNSKHELVMFYKHHQRQREKRKRDRERKASFWPSAA